MLRFISLNRLEGSRAFLSGRAVDSLMKLLVRFRYPVSLPEDVAGALGIEISNSVPFRQFLDRLTCPTCCPERLTRFMPRDRAEDVFTTALKKERFKLHSHFSYYFKGAWLEFILHFDNESRLRRLYIQHRDIGSDRGVEIALR